jgi:hypothetical protein
MNAKRRNDLIGGLLLISIGALVLVAKYVDLPTIPNLGLLFLPALGALFMLAGILSRNEGLMVPGGIISGIGWGTYLVTGPFAWDPGAQQGGVFLLAFALGWFSITVMSALFAKKTVWGTLVPAAVLAAIGGALFFGGAFMDVLTVAGKLWPLALIIGGGAIIFKAARRMEGTEKAKVSEA